jgi:hypothetical protein
MAVFLDSHFCFYVCQWLKKAHEPASLQFPYNFALLTSYLRYGYSVPARSIHTLDILEIGRSYGVIWQETRIILSGQMGDLEVDAGNK